jgi:Transcriptional regulator/sugar kinase
MSAAHQPSAGPGPQVIAIDVGGTDLKSATLDRAGRLGPIRRTRTPQSSGDPGGTVVAAIAALVASEPAAAIGVTIPGHVDEAAGVGVRSTNLGWRNYPFRERLAEATGRPVAITHDVRAAGEAEHRLGAGQGHQNVAFVAIGTGIAAALLLDGRPFTRGGIAGELGHTIVDPNGPQCRCGKQGCLEAISSAGAIAARYAAASARPVSGAAQVLDLARGGDELAAEVWSEAISGLVTGISILASLIAPEVVVIGGGLSEAGDDLLTPLRTGLAARSGSGFIPTLIRAELGQDAGTWGAALAARDLIGGVEE